MEDAHKKQFRGTWHPAEIDQHVMDGDISPLEYMLLRTIDSLTQPIVGCFAGNAYLAKCLNVSPKWIQRVIQRLVAKKFLYRKLKVVDGYTKRSLWTYWGRPKDWVDDAPATQTKTPRSGTVCKRGEGPFANGHINTNTIQSNTNTVPPAAACVGMDVGEVSSTTTEGTSMGFISPPAHVQQETTPAPTETQLSWAAALRHAIIKKGMLPPNRKANTKAWAQQFRLLEADGVPPERISAVLAWYCEHMAESKYSVQAFSGESFRKKFIAIELAASRHAEATKVYTVSGPDKAIYDEISHRAWPKASKAAVPKLIIESLEAYKRYYAKFLCLRHSKSHPKLASFLAELAHHIKSPERFILEWCETVRKQLVGWEDWEGHLDSFIWRADHNKFKRMGQEWSRVWGGDTRWWDQFTATMDELA